MSRELWAQVASFLTTDCINMKQRSFKFVSDFLEAGTNKAQEFEIPLLLHQPSNLLLGELKLNIDSEAAIVGDEMILDSSFEATSQKLRSLLTSDFAFNHIILGLTTDFRWGQYTCIHCHVSKNELSVPWHCLPEIPSKRTAATMKECVDKFCEGGLQLRLEVWFLCPY